MSLVKVINDEAFFRVADRAVQVHGGTGLRLGSPEEKLFRLARNLKIPAGTVEIQRNAIARGLLRRRAVRRSHAVTGRFQPVHHQHLELFALALAEHDHLVVAVTNPDSGARHEAATSTHRHTDAANPFTYFERLRLLRRGPRRGGARRPRLGRAVRPDAARSCGRSTSRWAPATSCAPSRRGRRTRRAGSPTAATR